MPVEAMKAPILVTLVTPEPSMVRSNVILGATVNEGPVPASLFPGAKPISEMKPSVGLGISQAMEVAANAWNQSEPTFMAEAMRTATKAWKNATSPRSYEIAEEVRAWRLNLIIDNVKASEDLELISDPSQNWITLAEAQIAPKNKQDQKSMPQVVMGTTTEIEGLVGEKRLEDKEEESSEVPVNPEIVYQEDIETEEYRLAKVRTIIASFTGEVDLHSVSEEMGDEEEADKSRLFSQLNIKDIPDGSYKRLRAEVDQEKVVSKDNALLIAIKAVLRHFPVKLGKGGRSVDTKYIEEEVLDRRTSIAQLKGEQAVIHR